MNYQLIATIEAAQKTLKGVVKQLRQAAADDEENGVWADRYIVDRLDEITWDIGTDPDFPTLGEWIRELVDAEEELE